jgi:cyclase
LYLIEQLSRSVTQFEKQRQKMTASDPSMRVVGGHSFPVGGLVDVSRAVYESAPLVVTEIRPRVFAFMGAGGTVTAIGGSSECAVIDTGFGPRVEEIRNAIASALHQSPRWLINTHWHFDHTDGNSRFTETGTIIVAHKNCRIRLSQDQYVRSLDWRISAASRSAWPVLTFNAQVSIDLGSYTLELLPQDPAHTDGDVAIWLSTPNVLVMGDLMSIGKYPIIDESSRGSLSGMIQALDRLLRVSNSETIVVPGHGPVGNQDSLLEFREVLRTIEGRIKPLIASGVSFSKILATTPTAEFDQVWGSGYVSGDTFVRMALAGFGVTEQAEDRKVA